MKHIHALLVIVANKTSTFRYIVGKYILNLPGRQYWLVKTKIFLAGLIADD